MNGKDCMCPTLDGKKLHTDRCVSDTRELELLRALAEQAHELRERGEIYQDDADMTPLFAALAAYRKEFPKEKP